MGTIHVPLDTKASIALFNSAGKLTNLNESKFHSIVDYTKLSIEHKEIAVECDRIACMTHYSLTSLISIVTDALSTLPDAHILQILRGPNPIQMLNMAVLSTMKVDGAMRLFGDT